MTSQPSAKWHIINSVFVCVIAAGAIAWLLQLNTFGITLGLAGLVISYFLWKKNRIAYFVAAVWCFGLLRIAMDDGYAFHGDYGAYVKLPYVIGIIIAIILHEKVAIKSQRSKQ
ncbi:hypothetical protein ACVBE9_10215 [Eionea flava]